MRLLLFILFFLPLYAAAQANYVLPNEKVIFSFESAKGKKMVLAQDKANGYIIYRFGNKDKIEMEFPSKTKESWKKFKYSFYMRGGGPANAAMDLNYIYFDNNNIRYVIYDTYYSETDKSAVGIKVIMPNDKTIDIKGDNKTRTGTMTDFRDNGLLEIGDELFD